MNANEEYTQERKVLLKRLSGLNRQPGWAVVQSLLDEAILDCVAEQGKPEVLANHGLLGGAAGGAGKLAEFRESLEELFAEADALLLSGKGS